MNQGKRPRVAAIGMDDARSESIIPLCGDLRKADSLEEYLQQYDWIETDIIVAEHLENHYVDPGVNLFIMGRASFTWTDTFQTVRGRSRYTVTADVRNTERELSILHTCPESYRALAVQLSNQLRLSDDPPAVLSSSRANKASIIETTSGKSVAIRIGLPPREVDGVTTIDQPIALILPQVTNLSDWFAAFLSDVYENDPGRVPQPPPRLSRPSDWYTPEERALAAQIEKASLDIDRFVVERERLQTELAAAGEKANGGTRRIIWVDGDDLVAAVREALVDFGFEVEDMDAGRKSDDPKREDLRLTLQDQTGWEAIVEVKGYSSGIRTNGTRQINEHIKRYTVENGREPDLTLWLTNPHRRMDPSSRPAPSSNVGDAAAIIDAVHVLTTDLFQQWILIKVGALAADDVVQDLINAAPGLWSPTALGNNP